jgi:hypothetical protein
MLSRENDKTFGDAHFNLAIMIASVLKKLSNKKLNSQACEALLTTLQSDDTLVNKTDAILFYCDNTANKDKILHKEILRQLMAREKQKKDPSRHVKHPVYGDFDLRISKLAKLSQDTQQSVIDYLKKSQAFATQYQSVPSQFLSAQMNNDTLNTQTKWNALMHYCKDKTNEHRDLYVAISYRFRDILYAIYKSHLKNAKFDEAAEFIDVFPDLCQTHVQTSIIHGAFKKEYMKYFLTHFTREEYTRVENARGYKVTMQPTLSLQTTLSSISFFKKEVSRSALIATYQNLSHLSELLNDDTKTALIAKIALEYRKIRSILTSSKESDHLLATLENPKEVKNAWAAIIEYMLERETDELSLKHNGKKLFRVITQVVSNQVNNLQDLGMQPTR